MLILVYCSQYHVGACGVAGHCDQSECRKHHHHPSMSSCALVDMCLCAWTGIPSRMILISQVNCNWIEYILSKQAPTPQHTSVAASLVCIIIAQPKQTFIHPFFFVSHFLFGSLIRSCHVRFLLAFDWSACVAEAEARKHNVLGECMHDKKCMHFCFFLIC